MSAHVPASIRRIVDKFSGTLGVAARDLKLGKEVLLNADKVFPTASMAKIPILLELYRQHEVGALSLGEMLTVRKKDKVGGSGVIVYLDDDVPFSLHDLAVLMMSVSDNTATNVLMDRLGISNINRLMRDSGMTNSHLHRKIKMKLPDKPRHPFFGTGTPRDYMTLMVNLYEGRMLNKRNTKAVLDLMRVQSYMGTLWRYLDFDSNGHKEEWVASKNGYSSGIRTEAGIVHSKRGAYAICVMGKDIKDKAWTQDNEGTLAIASVSKAVRDYFFEK